MAQETKTQRAAIEQQLRRYWQVQGQFRQLTRREYQWQMQGPWLPSDSVQSPRWDGLPVAQGVTSDPTVRVIMLREEILARRAAAEAELRATIDRLADELLQMVELWRVLSLLDRWLIELYFWRGLSQEEVADWFRRHVDLFEGWPEVPASQASVSRAVDKLLDFVETLWRSPAVPATVVNENESSVDEIESSVHESE